MTTTPATKTFTVGRTYEMRSPGDYDCVVRYEVARRTACYVTLRHVRGDKETRCRVSEYDGTEFCSPWGNYSLSPILSARTVQS